MRRICKKRPKVRKTKIQREAAAQTMHGSRLCDTFLKKDPYFFFALNKCFNKYPDSFRVRNETNVNVK